MEKFGVKNKTSMGPWAQTNQGSAKDMSKLSAKNKISLKKGSL